MEHKVNFLSIVDKAVIIHAQNAVATVFFTDKHIAKEFLVQATKLTVPTNDGVPEIVKTRSAAMALHAGFEQLSKSEFPGSAQATKAKAKAKLKKSGSREGKGKLPDSPSPKDSTIKGRGRGKGPSPDKTKPKNANHPENANDKKTTI